MQVLRTYSCDLFTLYDLWNVYFLLKYGSWKLESWNLNHELLNRTLISFFISYLYSFYFSFVFIKAFYCTYRFNITSFDFEEISLCRFTCMKVAFKIRESWSLSLEPEQLYYTEWKTVIYVPLCLIAFLCQLIHCQ